MNEIDSLKNSLVKFEDVPEIYIDISSTIEERYQKILKFIDIEKCKTIIENIYDEYSSYFSIIKYLLNCNSQYWDEISLISKILSISPYKLYTFGVILDNMNCTSSICNTFNNTKYLIKSFEFNSKSDIKPLIFRTVYSNNGNLLYESINIFGSVGIYNLKNLTHKYNISFSSKISLQNSWTFNAVTTSQLLRKILENNFSFDKSLELLCKTVIQQPVYFMTFKYDQKYSFVIQRETNSHQIIKKETVIITDTDEQTFTPNINFSVSRYKDIEKMENISLNKFVNRFFSFPIIRGSTQFITIQTKNDCITKLL